MTSDRTYRWQTWLTPRRVLALGALFSAGAQTLLLPVGGPPWAFWGVAGALALVTAVLARRNLDEPARDGSRLLIVALLGSFAAWQGLLDAMPLRAAWLQQIVVAAPWLALGAALATYLGVAADKALLVAGSLCVALAAIEAIGIPGLARRTKQAVVDTPAHARALATAERRHVRAVALPPREFPYPVDVWVRGRSYPDPELVYALEPYSLFKQYYPDNPLGYFYEESAADLALRSFWQTPGDGSYYLAHTSDDGSAIHVYFRTPFRPREYHPQVSWGRFAVAADQPLSIRFRGRCAQPLRIDVMCSGSERPWPVVCRAQPCELTAEWQSFELSARPDESQTSAMLLFVLPPVDVPVELADVAVFSGEARLPIQPIAGLNRHYVSYAMNSYGYRDVDPAVPRPMNVFRIVCLGDSYTFGQGVHRQDLLTTVLAERLNEQAFAAGEPTRFEVLNCAVCGYSTKEERVLLERMAQTLQPQLVLAMVVQNDDVNFRDDQERMAREASQFGATKAIQAATAARSRRDFTRTTAELEKMRIACGNSGAQLAVVVFRHEPIGEGGDWENLLATLRNEHVGERIPLLDVGDALLGEYDFRDLQVYPGGDHHPNHLAHRAAAVLVEQFLRAQRLVPLAP